jgi:hypothetical protein
VERRNDKDRLDLLQKLVLIVLGSVVLAGVGNVGFSAYGMSKDGEQDLQIALVVQDVDTLGGVVEELVETLKAESDEEKASITLTLKH